MSYPLPDDWEAAITAFGASQTVAGLSNATRALRRSHLRYIARRSATEGPDRLDAEQVEIIFGTPEWSAHHRDAIRGSLRSFYGWYCRRHPDVPDPTVDLPKVKLPSAAAKPATDEIWTQILETADPRARIMARLAGEAGLRRAEVAQVHTNDLLRTSDGTQLIVHGKGGKQRVIHITVSLADEIVTACRSGYLFPGRINGHISPDRVGKVVSGLMPPGWSIHKLRHRYATRGYRGTRNLRAVQQALGHASIATTERYTAVSSQEVRAVSEAAEWQPLGEDSSL